jgi:hypothetical protein
MRGQTIGPGSLPAGTTKRVGDSCQPRPLLPRRVVQGTYTFADDAPRPVPTASATSSTQWSRPIRIDVCSMFARMPRYGPAPPGIRSEARMQATGQNDSPRHVLTSFDSSSRGINEQISGLLIRGFGVQVPGGAPGLAWGFTTPGHFYVSVLSPCLLRVCSGARTLQSGSCQKRPIRHQMRGHAPPDPRRIARPTPHRLRPASGQGPLDQWSRP